MIKPTLLVKLLKARLAKQEAATTQDDIDDPREILADEVAFLKTVLKEAAQSTHDYSP